MRLELEQNASAVAQLERSAVVGSNGSTTSHFNEVLSNGISAAQAGHRAQARILLQYAIELDPKSEAGWLWLASISEYPEELLIFLDRVLEINAKNSRALEWKAATKQLLAKTFVQRGIDAANEERNQDAMSCFDTALSYDEQSQLAWFWKDSLSKQAVSEEPEAVAVEAIELEEESATEAVEFVPEPSKYEQAEAALAAGDRQQALSFVNAAINEFPELEKAWALRSHLVDDFDEKRRSLERVVEINPDNATARAALETLLAMIETVAPNAQTGREAETQLFSNSPFDSIAEHVPVVDDKMPTGELEFPDAFVQHNPFAETENYEMAGDVWESDAGMETTTEEPNRSEESFSADDFPTIIVPFDEDAEPLYVSSEHFSESSVQLPTDFGFDSAVAYAETAVEVTSTPEVQEVSASNYLEDSSPASQFDTDAEGSSWQDEPAYAREPDTGHADTWVVEDSDAYPVEEPIVNTAQTILVVDDSAVVRKLIAGKLEESGYNVISAGSGVEALAAMSNSRPDLVLLDIAMPKMDGYQVCEKIRKNELTRDIPVVMISGKDGYFDEDRGQKAGTSSFISKPFGPETLMKALDTYLPSPAVH